MQQKPPVSFDKEQSELLGSFSGMFLTFTFETRHFNDAAKIEKATWMLLTFYRQLDLHIESFKVTAQQTQCSAFSKISTFVRRRDGIRR